MLGIGTENIIGYFPFTMDGVFNGIDEGNEVIDGDPARGPFLVRFLSLLVIRLRVGSSPGNQGENGANKQEVTQPGENPQAALPSPLVEEHTGRGR